MRTTTIDEVMRRGYSFVVYGEPDGGGWSIIYPDLPGCMSQADTWDEIGVMAEDALRTWVEAMVEADRPIPEPVEPPLPVWDWSTVGEQPKTT